VALAVRDWPTASPRSGISAKVETAGFASAGLKPTVDARSRGVQNAIRRRTEQPLGGPPLRARGSGGYEDDGRGFDSSVKQSGDTEHYGLIGMQERVEKLGGEFHLASSPGKGTQVRLTIPVARSRR
jgi:hypothetical protein